MKGGGTLPDEPIRCYVQSQEGGGSFWVQSRLSAVSLGSRGLSLCLYMQMAVGVCNPLLDPAEGVLCPTADTKGAEICKAGPFP